MYSPLEKKDNTPFLLFFGDFFFFEGVGNRSGSFYIQRSVRSTSCVTINKEKVYNKMAHQLFFLFLFFVVFFFSMNI